MTSAIYFSSFVLFMTMVIHLSDIRWPKDIKIGTNSMFVTGEVIKDCEIVHWCLMMKKHISLTLLNAYITGLLFYVFTGRRFIHSFQNFSYFPLPKQIVAEKGGAGGWCEKENRWRYFYRVRFTCVIKVGNNRIALRHRFHRFRI